MSTTTAVVMTAALAVTGAWVKDKSLSIRLAVGIGGVALFLAVIAEADAKLAQQLGVLILIGAVFVYGPDIVKAVNF